MKKCSNLDRYNSPEGVCTSLAFSDEANAAVIRLVVELWLNEVAMQTAHRNHLKWEEIHDLPMDFNSFMYRRAQ